MGEEVVVPEEGNPFKQFVIQKPGSGNKSKTISFTLEPHVILEASYVAGLGPTEKKKRPAPKKETVKKEEKKEEEKPAEATAKPRTSFIGSIRRGMSIKKGTPPAAKETPTPA